MPGINGIRRCFVDNYLYLTNTDRAMILRLAIDRFDYRPKGQLEVIVQNIVCDDFSIDRIGAIYVTTHVHNSLIRLTPVKDGEYLREEIATLADGLAGVTSCVFGRTYQDRTRCSSITNAIRKRGGKKVKIDHIIFIFDQRNKKNISLFSSFLSTQASKIFIVPSIYLIVVFE
jgi:hypothetical protein